MTDARGGRESEVAICLKHGPKRATALAYTKAGLSEADKCQGVCVSTHGVGACASHGYLQVRWLLDAQSIGTIPRQ